MIFNSSCKCKCLKKIRDSASFNLFYRVDDFGKYDILYGSDNETARQLARGCDCNIVQIAAI